MTTIDGGSQVGKHRRLGLYRTGPHPWDFAFQPAEGMKIATVMPDGQMNEGVITSFTENTDTGELKTQADPIPNEVSSVMGWLNEVRAGRPIVKCAHCEWTGDRFPVHMLTCTLGIEETL